MLEDKHHIQLRENCNILSYFDILQQTPLLKFCKTKVNLIKFANFTRFRYLLDLFLIIKDLLFYYNVTSLSIIVYTIKIYYRILDNTKSYNGLIKNDKKNNRSLAIPYRKIIE